MADLFTISRGALLPALSATSKAVEKNTTIPIMQNIRLSYDDGALLVTGTNLDIEITARAEAEDLSPFSGFTLPATTLHNAVRKMPDGAMIKFSQDKKKDANLVNASTGRSRFQLITLPESDFPEMSASTFTHQMQIPAKQLAETLGLVSFAISTEETRYYLNGIYWHLTGDEDNQRLAAVATDGHRLALNKVPVPEGLASDMPGIIIPRRTVTLLAALATGEGDVSIELNTNRIRFSFADGTVLSSKLVDGKFPEYERVIPAANETCFKLIIEPVKQAIDRVITLSNDKGNGCKFQFDNDHLALSVNNPAQGSAEDQVPVERVKGDPVTIGFNSKYCLDLFGAANCKEAFISLSDAGSPALIHPSVNGAPSETTSFVLMPMRV